MPMEPALSRPEEVSGHRGTHAEFHSDVAGWPSQPRLVPTKFLCEWRACSRQHARQHVDNAC